MTRKNEQRELAPPPMLTSPKPSPLVLLRPGASAPPIFIAPGHGDNASELLELCDKIQSPRQIFGLQPRGLEGADEPHDRIEDIARDFLSAILEVQPHGPYNLVGFSFGGMVIFEIAHQLMHRSEKISFLGLLDAYPHPRYWPLKCWLGVLGGRARYHAAKLRNLSMHETIPYFTKLSESVMDHLRSRIGKKPRMKWSKGTIAGSETLKRLENSNLVALSRYKPKRLRGEVTFVQSVPLVLGGTKFPADPAMIWSGLCESLQHHTIRSDHREMVRTHGDRVASVLSQCLKEAIGHNSLP
jgi:acetoacetyl-CoA synthetase